MQWKVGDSGSLHIVTAVARDCGPGKKSNVRDRTYWIHPNWINPNIFDLQVPCVAVSQLSKPSATVQMYTHENCEVRDNLASNGKASVEVQFEGEIECQFLLGLCWV
jgi:hypothetical protein